MGGENAMYGVGVQTFVDSTGTTRRENVNASSAERGRIPSGKVEITRRAFGSVVVQVSWVRAAAAARSNGVRTLIESSRVA